MPFLRFPEVTTAPGPEAGRGRRVGAGRQSPLWSRRGRRGWDGVGGAGPPVPGPAEKEGALAQDGRSSARSGALGARDADPPPPWERTAPARPLSGDRWETRPHNGSRPRLDVFLRLQTPRPVTGRGLGMFSWRAALKASPALRPVLFTNPAWQPVSGAESLPRLRSCRHPLRGPGPPRPPAGAEAVPLATSLRGKSAVLASEPGSCLLTASVELWPVTPSWRVVGSSDHAASAGAEPPPRLLESTHLPAQSSRRSLVFSQPLKPAASQASRRPSLDAVKLTPYVLSPHSLPILFSTQDCSSHC
ncbi:uncharacterized protein LOC144578212 [Callithrix jacchus]